MSRWDVKAIMTGKDGRTNRYGKMAGADGWHLLDLNEEAVRWTDDPGWFLWTVRE